jgi:hypothetical protein
MSGRNHQRWEQDVDARQRNIVFPGTAANEARFWRNLIASKRRLTLSQWVGFGLMGFTLVLAALLPIFGSHGIYGSWLAGIESAAINLGFGAAFLVVFLLVLTCATRRKRRG